MLNLKFKERKFTVYTGVAPSRIVEEEGTPIINPDRETLAKYLDGVDEEGDEIKYVYDAEVTAGTDGFGGLKLTSTKQYEEMAPEKQEKFTVKKTNNSKVRFLMETVVGSGKERRKHYYLLDFLLYNAPHFSNGGDKKKMFNDVGQVGWFPESGTPPYENFVKEGIKPAPASKTGSLGFEELVEFIYSYAAQKTGDVQLLANMEMDAILEGDVSTVVETFEIIHTQLKNQKGRKLYGVKVLFMPVNNDYTNNQTRQDFYPKFERLVEDKDGTIKETFNVIKGAIVKSRKPAKNGQIYDPESKGWYVGEEGMPHWGIREIKEGELNKLINNQAKSNPTNAMGSGSEDPFSNVTDDELPFGDEQFEL